MMRTRCPAKRGSLPLPTGWVPLCIVVALVMASAPKGAHAGWGVWTSHGPEGGYVEALAIDPSTPARLYAGTWGGGVFKSTDSGSSWSPANGDLTSPFIQGLAIDPSTPTTVYAGTRTGGVVFKSTDGGSSWSPANSGLLWP